MEEIRFYKRPRLRNPYLMVAWPGMGEVAFKAVTYLIEKLKAEDLAEIPAKDFFYLTESVVKEGVLSIPELPFNKFFFYKDKSAANDIIFFLSDAQPDLAKAEEYSRRILSVAKSFRVKTIVSFAAMPQAVDHAQEPHVWATATSKELLESLQKAGIDTLNEGQISGLNGLFLGIAKREGYDGFCLLAEIPLYTIQIENPKAAQAVIEAWTKISPREIDLSEIKEQAQSMDNQINSLLEHLKLGPANNAPGPIGEDEIEKIKKSLSQLTRLPASIKEKIEKLFIESRTDIAKAGELKAELDKWNVYKEYEDRFLDLFKKSKEKNN